MKPQFFVKTISVLVINFVGFISVANSQGSSKPRHQGHESSTLEVGLSVGYVRIVKEEENAVNLHFHVMKKISAEGIGKYFSMGFGVESIFANEEHYAGMISLGIHPWGDLTVILSPGWEWANHEGAWESGWAAHMELAYTFEGKGFHYGPVLSYSKTEHDQHLSVGLHLAIAF
jgi:hypothetical protein